MFDVFFQSFKDYFTPKILLLTFAPCIIGVIVGVFLLYTYGDIACEWVLGIIPDRFKSDNIIGDILSVSANLLVYSFLFVFFVISVLLFNVFCSIFYTPYIVSYLHQQYFPHIKRESFGGILNCLREFIKLFVIFTLIFVICIPLYFVPILGHFVLFVIGYFLFKKMIFYDITSAMMNKTDSDQLQRSFRLEHYSVGLVAYVLGFIPLVHFFVTPLQTLIITRYFFKKLSLHRVQES